MINFLKKKKLHIIISSSILFILISISTTVYFFYNKMSPTNESESIEMHYLKNYSKNKFVKNALKDTDVYNKKNLKNYIIKNFDIFLKINSEVNKSVFNYAELYQESFKVLNNLKENKVISYKDFKEINEYLKNFQFLKIINILNNNTFTAKKYFEGIIYELNFNYILAKSSYIEAIKFNKYEPKYYFNLGNIYYKLYNFDSAIYTFSNGLNISSFNSKKNKNIKLKLLFNLGQTYSLVKNTEKATSTYTNLLINSISSHNETYEWLAIYNLSFLEANVGNYYSAINYLKYALKLATKIKNKELIANSLNTLSKINYQYGDYNNGKKNALKAIKFAKKISNIGLIADASFNACLNYEYLQTKKSKELSNIYCKRALKINNFIGKIIERPEYFINNGFIYSFVSSFKDYKVSLNNYKTAYDISKKLNLFLYEITSLYGISENNNIIGNNELAIEALNKAIKLEKKLKINKNSLNDIKLAEIYWSTGDIEKAITYYKKSLFSAIKFENNLNISTASSHLTILYYDLKNYKDAIKYATISLDATEKVYKPKQHYIEYQKNWLEKILNEFNNKNSN